MEKNDFFRQAVLRICGNLEIERVLHSLLLFLKDYMPISKMVLQHYDRNYRAMRTIADADETCGNKLDLLTPLSKIAGEMADNVPKEPDIFLIEDPMSHAVSREMTTFHGIQAKSIILLVLRTDGETLGYLVLLAVGPDKFLDQHLDRVLMLKEPFVVAMANALKHRQVLKLNDLLADDNRYLHGELRRLSGDEIVGANFGLKQVMYKVQQVASLDSPVLLLGETGTGKDVIANAIHFSSARSEGPFVSVNCGAIPDTLIDSELFGHEKGAFTGALSQKRGRFERANKGTIFLDEIGELPLQAQVRLLKVLQSREIERVGGVKTISLDIRIIAATNRNIEEMVAQQQFREDLWFRINVFPIWIPPLRDRPMDLPTLIQHFIDHKARQLKLPQIPTLAPGAIEPLMTYHWPGNVRELENIIERTLILNPKGPLSFEHLNLGSSQQGLSVQGGQAKTDNLDTIVASHIRRVLIQAKGRVNGPDGTAARLGINPSTLRNRMKKLGIAYGRKHT
jgi:transcriptional regulator with GAF, ATPase, and Fis domain